MYETPNRNYAEPTRIDCTAVPDIARNLALDGSYDSAYRGTAKRIARLLHASQVAMSVSYALIVADNVRPPKGSSIAPGVPGAAGYEPGHSERQATGSVAVGPEGRWSATLAVPMTGDQSLLVAIQREGPTPPGAPAVPDVTLVIPPGEAEAVLTLLRGIVAQARRDGVLSRPGLAGRARAPAQDRPG
jgi:hypothetical protein